MVRLRRFVHILLVDNELAQPKTNGATMERAARNKEESGMMEEQWSDGRVRTSNRNVVVIVEWEAQQDWALRTKQSHL